MTLLVNGMEAIASGLNHASHWSDSLPVLLSHFGAKANLLAQQVDDPDILGQIQRAWNNFVKSGQIWALIIGIVIGYVFRGFRGS